MTKAIEPKVAATRQRAEQLQFLRFLGFWNIFMVHTEEWAFFPYPTSHCSNATVSFFFLLSGLVIGLSRYGREEDLSFAQMGSYMWKRICKYYPVYFIALMLSVLYSPIPTAIATQNFESLKESLTYLTKHLLMIQSWFPLDEFRFNGAGWYLSSLIPLMLLNLPVSALLNKIRKYRFGLPLMLMGSLGAAFVVVVYCYFTQDVNMYYWHYMFPLARIPEYLIGIIWGFLICEIKARCNPNKLHKWVFTALEIFVLVFWVFSLSRPGNYWRNYIISWLKPNCMLLIVFALGYGWVSDLFRLKPLVWLGDMSFGCYLIHGIVIKTFRGINGIFLPNTQSEAFAFFYCLIMSVLLAYMLDNTRKQQKGKVSR